MGAKSTKGVSPPPPRRPQVPAGLDDMGWANRGDPVGVWGPIYWNKIHTRAIAWPSRAQPQTVAAEHAWLRNLFKKLPCENCSNHALKYYINHYPDLTSNGTYHTWVYSFHNSVNIRTGKPEMPYSAYQELYRRELVAAGLC